MDDKRNGQGSLTFPNGDKYEGGFKDGFPHGQGRYSYSDGKMYKGELKDGKRNGQGTFIFPDGNKYVGEFKDGIPWNGLGYDKNGNIIVKVVNGDGINK